MGRPTIYQLTAERTRLLRAAYANPSIRYPSVHCSKRPEFAGVPDYCIRRWASALGITRVRPWTRTQQDFVEDHHGKHPLEWIAQVIGRSPRAVQEQAHKMNLDDGYYSAHDIGAMLGVHHTRVLGWEREGWLHAGAGTHRYTPFDLGKFLWKHPAEAYTGAMTFEIFLSMVSHMAIASRPVERRSPQPKEKVG